MALAKTNTVVLNAVTLTAGAGARTDAGPTITSARSVLCLVKITNGATGPTVAAQTLVQVSADGTNWYTLATLQGLVTNAAVSEWDIDLPYGAMYVQFVSGSNTGQNVTLRIDVVVVTE